VITPGDMRIDQSTGFLEMAGTRTQGRSEFIVKTYVHVALAIGIFTLLEAYYFTTGIAGNILQTLGGVSWMLVLGAFMVVSWGASHVAHRVQAKPAQYAALFAMVFMQSIIFVPMLAMAMQRSPTMIQSAAGVTLLGAGGLTAVAVITRKDFSFLRGILLWGGILAVVGVFASMIFGFQLGTWFSVAMIGFAGAAVLYDTSNILKHYPSDRYVAASLELFASIALMFWYVLRYFLNSRD
jgi:uncharacterized protein